MKKKQEKQTRVFIVEPQYEHDRLHQVCTTTTPFKNTGELLEIYWADKYECYDGTNSIIGARKIARKELKAKGRIPVI